MANGLRFHLAEDRIREFLMGENLYGDPALAIRELYQNALDAYRLATARRELRHLPVRAGTLTTPDIEFEQGIDDLGRPYLDCVDNGAGMGLDELSMAFCQAGMRASDLPGRDDERAAFDAATPPVQLWQNSRFGIGVMSYFMIADAVTVVTAQLEPGGTMGRVLSMHIPGPAEVFDVVDHGPAPSHGTRVRLWLKPSAQVSAVSTLRDLVITCPVYLRAHDTRGPEHWWLPHHLNHASAKLELRPNEYAVEVPGSLWWVKASCGGTVIADGIWAGEWLPGMVVDLHGPDAPKLTADRRNIVGVDYRLIDRRAARAAESAVEHAWHIVGGPEWLTDMTARLPRLADAVIAAASKRVDRSITIHGSSVDVAASGYMAGDAHRRSYGHAAGVLSWRLERLRAGGLFSDLGLVARPGPRPEPARPSDAVLLGDLSRFDRPERPSSWFASSASIYQAERYLHYPMQQIISRARQLGLPVRADADLLPDSNETVRTALSFSRREHEDGTFRMLGVFDLIRTSWRLGLPMDEVLAELDARWIEFDESARGRDSALSPAELLAVSRNANGIAPWLDSWTPIGLDHVVQASRASGRPCDAIVGQLRSLGFSDLPELSLAGQSPSDDDVVMLSRDLDGEGPFLCADEVVPTAHLRAAGRALGQAEVTLRQRFSEFGISFSDDGPFHVSEPRTKREILKQLGLNKKDLKRTKRRSFTLMSQDGDGAAPWFDPTTPIPAWAVATIALHKRPIDDVVADFMRLGYDVDDPRTVAFQPVPGTELPYG